jgi:hypothetical protein
MTATSRHLLTLTAVVIIGAGLIGGFLYLRGGESDTDATVTREKNTTDTFTFFGLGPGTTLSNNLQDRLENLLGNGGVETRTTIDLTMDGVTDFAGHFPRLAALHQALNYLPRQRVQHDTTQLTYHYARKQNVPFDRVRLVFWEERDTPLYFSLYAKRDGEDFIQTIREKHGDPQEFGDETQTGRVLYWQKENALLIISITRNRIGFNEYNFGIYYLDNLTALAETEKTAREAAEEEKEKTGELVF